MGYWQALPVLLIAFVCQVVAYSSSTSTHHLCPKDHSISLLKFKQTLTVDPSTYNYICEKSYEKTSAWNMSRDCCLWDGVYCDEMAGYVTELDLSCSMLVGTINSNSSLFQLSQLQRLNLSGNDFSNSYISPKFGRFSSLTHLDLSDSQFSGQVPFEISHLSKLQSLRLPTSVGELWLSAHDFRLLLQNLTQLRELDLSEVSISSNIPRNFSSHITTLRLDDIGLRGMLPHQIFHLPNLKEVDFSGDYQLSGYFPTTKWNSSASITKLKLSGVNFSGALLPESLGYLTSLQYLELNDCNLSGHIPESLGNLALVESLDLGNNHIEGPIPLSLGNLTSLRSLRLDSCNLSGLIPKSLWNLSSIESLVLPNNRLEGPIPLFTSGLQNLYSLSLTNNSLSGAIPSWIFSLPSLRSLYLNFNHFSGQLEDFKCNANTSLINLNLEGNLLQGRPPKSIQNLVNLIELDLSFNNFCGDIDVSFFTNLQQLSVMDLSNNDISLTNENKVKSTLPGSLANLMLSACDVKELDFLRSAKQLFFLDLSNNKIEGRIPDWAWSNWKSLLQLDLSHNLLTSIDQISSFPVLRFIDLRSNFLQGSLPIPPPSLEAFFISDNNLTGEIHSSVCKATRLKVVDLARNNLNGAIPPCLGNMSDGLEVLDMQHNSLSGNLSATFRLASGLKSFNLHGNKIEGKIPRSLANCMQLEVVDLGNNLLNDTFPMWLGTLPMLQVLSLRSNKLHGSIGSSRIKNLFPQLRMIDLSSNSFTAELPASLFQNLRAMRRLDQTIKARRVGDVGYYQDSVTVVTKGRELEVVRILSLYVTVDLSNNKFEGPIPSVMGDLISLRVFNLSHNGLQGHIPPSLGNLSVVESLDLSSNQLSGEIPQQLASELLSLAYLNLSHNHLGGCIPQGPQFATFENTSYEGNNGLRGFPVSKDCGSKWRPETNNTTRFLDGESDSTFLSELSWKVVLMGYGCGLSVGFSTAYFMLSSRNPNWLSRIAEELEYRIIMKRRKKQRRQRAHTRRRNN